MPPKALKKDIKKALGGDAYLAGAKLAGADLSGTNFAEDVTFTDADLRGANLSNCVFAGGYFEAAKLDDATLAGATLIGTRTQAASLRRVDMTGANFLGCSLDESNFTGANFRDARCVDTSFSWANLTGADFRGAYLIGVDFRDAKIEGANFEGAYADSTTRFSRGKRPALKKVSRRSAKEHFTFPDPTRSSAFKRWFGESKVVDSKGNPLVVYHGTRRGGFSVFRAPKGDIAKRSIFFTSSFDAAKTYSGDIGRGTLPDPVSGEPVGAYRVYLKILKPFVCDAKGKGWYQLACTKFKGMKTTGELADAVERSPEGYDGIILKNVLDMGAFQSGRPALADVYVVFSPLQIKSATANAGTFDPNDPDIRHNPRTYRSR